MFFSGLCYIYLERICIHQFSKHIMEIDVKSYCFFTCSTSLFPFYPPTFVTFAWAFHPSPYLSPLFFKQNTISCPLLCLDVIIYGYLPYFHNLSLCLFGSILCKFCLIAGWFQFFLYPIITHLPLYVFWWENTVDFGVWTNSPDDHLKDLSSKWFFLYYNFYHNRIGQCYTYYMVFWSTQIRETLSQIQRE